MQGLRRRYLVIDDDPGDIETLRRLLTEMSSREMEVASFTDVEAALSELDSGDFDLIFIDYLLGAERGLDVFESIRARGCECPVVLVTGQGSEEVAVDAMKAGVADYIVKGSFSANTLHRVVINALAKFDLEQRVKEQQLRLAEKVEELEDALAHVVALQGLLPICMWCKKIRNDEGSWDRIEKYISEHSDAQFSHCICPDCAAEHYPDHAPPRE